jgi:hypothetical protein
MKRWILTKQPATMTEDELVGAVLSLGAAVKAAGLAGDYELVKERQHRLFLVCVEVEHRMSGLGYDAPATEE